MENFDINAQVKNFNKSSSSSRPSRFDNNYSSSNSKFNNNRYKPYNRPNGHSHEQPQDLEYEHTLSKFSHDSPYCDLGLLLKSDHNLESKMFKKASTVINFDQNMSIDIKATGSDIKKAINSFTECNLHEIMINNIKLSNYERPTPVQKNTIPIIASKRDLMACAQTGSGKTAAFLIPIMNSIFESKEPIESFKMVGGYRQWLPVGLVLAPTRELALQIYDESKKLAYRSNLRTFVVYGGADIRTQMRNLDSNGCHLLVATPGRLNDLYNREIISFENIKYLVLDEADRMLDMGFEPQIREIVQQKNMPDSKTRQTLLFSATFPKQIQMLAKDFLNNYIFLAVGRVGSTNVNITQRIVWASEKDKLGCLIDTLDKNPDVLTLIFVETRRSCDQLEKHLKASNYPAISIHGKKSQSERERSLQMFRSGKRQILVATAVAARGLDISNVKVVVNFDVPNDIDDYVHRIGRTGRSGACGEAVSFFNEKNRQVANELLNLLKETQQEIPDFLNKMAVSRGGGYHQRSNYGNFRNASNGNNSSSRHHYFDYRTNDS